MRRTLLMAMTICSACGATPKAPDPAPRGNTEHTTPAVADAASTPKSSAPAPQGACEAMTRTECMQSTQCTLEHEAERSKRYRCRPATEPCELGFAQAGFWGSGTEGVRRSKEQQAACDARPGCAFADGGCYCHCRGMGQTTVPDGDEAQACHCECSAGPPPTCRAAP
jgi:hypothetical protein